MTNFRIEMTGEVSVKRFYLDNSLLLACPECGQMNPVPNGYLSYPNAGEWEQYEYYCYNEETEEEHMFPFSGKLVVTFEIGELDAERGTIYGRDEET